ncbi:MAG: poly-gamma-glutamate system protein [Polyangiales bacterium]
MYWKPEGASQVQRALVAALAITGLVAVERFPTEEQQPHYAEKMLAARKAQEALGTIRAESEKRGLPTLEKTDPSGSRLIGVLLSPITSGSGSLVSKQTTVNPNFAAVVVQWLKDIGIKSGDVVAVGLSGSFPAFNIAVYAAMHELDVEPIIISSTAASQWGANNPGFTWLDMETSLRKDGVFPYKSVAASLGGVGDEAIGLTSRGHKMLTRAIERNDIPGIGVLKDSAEPTVDEIAEEAPSELAAVDQNRVRERMRIYYENAGDRPIRAYVNVGGGTVSVGTKVGKRKFLAGLNRRLPKGIDDMPPSVLGAFLESGVPVIHGTRMIDIAEEYGLELAPRRTPEVGQGDVFQKREPNRWLAGIVLVLILLSLFVIARAPWGTRMLRTTIPPESIVPPAPRPPREFQAKTSDGDGNGAKPSHSPSDTPPQRPPI